MTIHIKNKFLHERLSTGSSQLVVNHVAAISVYNLSSSVKSDKENYTGKTTEFRILKSSKFIHPLKAMSEKAFRAKFSATDFELF